jgi:hypothetical protein
VECLVGDPDALAQGQRALPMFAKEWQYFARNRVFNPNPCRHANNVRIFSPFRQSVESNRRVWWRVEGLPSWPNGWRL